MSAWLYKFRLIKWGFCENKWVWFHILGGGVLAHFLLLFLPPGPVFLLLFFAAIWWEFLEAVSADIKVVYGSWEHFFFDAAGDILGTLFCAILVVI